MSKEDTSVNALIAMVPDDMRGVAEALAGEICFMEQTLTTLKAHIAEFGPVEWYQNGKQECWRESPAMKSYSALIPRYNATIKQLVALLPSEVAQDKGDELDEWLKSTSPDR